MSGFLNTDSSGSANQGISGFPSGLYSGYNSGWFNAGTGIAGLFNLGRL